ncbi:ADP-glyceromanno-heptose 6-epimerase [Chlamydiales bacterium]|nr:ADP-glyceromanno-heptose 6-epimerase [Chlamydiales bacterium]
MKFFDDKYVVVTGGAGFIGSCVIQELNSQGFSNIIIIDDLGTDERWKNLVGKKFADIIPVEFTFDWFDHHEEEVQAIIHLGASSDTTENDASYLLENNYRYSTYLCDWAIENDVRFIYASSAATYGDGLLGFSDDHSQLESFKPLNMYGYSKHLFDLWAKKNGFLDQIVGLKYFNVFGPNENHKGRMASLIAKVTPGVDKGEKITLFASNDKTNFKDGDQSRDFLYVKDAARITCAFLHNDAVGIFNVGSGLSETWNAMATYVFEAADKPKNIEYIKMPQDLEGKYQNFTCAETLKLQNTLGETAKTTSLKVAITDYVQNYLLPQKLY